MIITENDRQERKDRCNNCKSTSMEWCMTHLCPYYVTKHYNDADRDYYNRVIKRIADKHMAESEE